MANKKDSLKTSRRWQNFVIVTFLVLITIDSFPGDSPVFKELRRIIDPITDVTGIWQEPWGLYAPIVDRENSWIEARVYVEDQAEPVLLRSPDWNTLSCFEKFRNSREIEFYDRIRFDNNSAARPSFAAFLIREYERLQPNDIVTKIELISVTTRTPPPKEAGTKPEIKRILYYTLEPSK